MVSDKVQKSAPPSKNKMYPGGKAHSSACEEKGRRHSKIVMDCLKAS
jgi:hypothetical protein